MDTINNIETAKKRFIDYLDEAIENEMRNTIYLISDVAISEIFNPEQIKNLRKKNNIISSKEISEKIYDVLKNCEGDFSFSAENVVDKIYEVMSSSELFRSIKKNTLEIAITDKVTEYFTLSIIKEIVNSSKEQFIDDNILFLEYGILSSELEKSKLSRIDKQRILIDILNKNLSNACFNEDEYGNYLFLGDFINKYEFSAEEAFEILSNDKYKYLLSCDDDNLSSLEKRQKALLQEGIAYNAREEIDETYNDHIIIKKHYLDKIDQFGDISGLEKEDVDLVCNSLKNIGVVDELVESIRYTLEKKVKQTTQTTEYKWKETKKKQQELISDKEYKKARKEIGAFFNLYTGLVERDLTEDEIIHCTSLMLKIGIDSKTVETFIDRSKPEYQNPIARYINNYDKLKYYGEKLGFKYELGTLDEIFKETFVVTPSDYQEWKKMLNQELTAIESKIPNNCEYELHKAKQYIKKK